MILLDTQAMAWLALEPEKLSRAASAVIVEARKEAGIAISDKTLWELGMMFSQNRMDIGVTLLEFLRQTEQRCTVLPVNSAVAARSVQFSRAFPSDPADRIIAATAIVYELPLVTADSAIRKSGEVPCIW
jgi:PIN domain nuclease of toxin-antitoxin system